MMNVCTALHEEYVACTGKVRNHKALFASFPLTAATLNVCIQVVVLQTHPFYIPGWSWYWGVCQGGHCTSFHVYTGDILLVRNAVFHDPDCHQV